MKLKIDWSLRKFNIVLTWKMTDYFKFINFAKFLCARFCASI